MRTPTRKTFKASAQPYTAPNGASRPNPLAGSVPARSSKEGVVVAWQVLYHLVGDEPDTWRVTQPMFEVDAVTKVEQLEDKYGEYVVFPHDGPLREIRGHVNISRAKRLHDEAEKKVDPRKYHLNKWHEEYVRMTRWAEELGEKDDVHGAMEMVDEIIAHCERLSCTDVEDLRRHGIFDMNRCLSPLHDERLHG